MDRGRIRNRQVQSFFPSYQHPLLSSLIAGYLASLLPLGPPTTTTARIPARRRARCGLVTDSVPCQWMAMEDIDPKKKSSCFQIRIRSRDRPAADPVSWMKSFFFHPQKKIVGYLWFSFIWSWWHSVVVVKGENVYFRGGEILLHFLLGDYNVIRIPRCSSVAHFLTSNEEKKQVACHSSSALGLYLQTDTQHGNLPP